MTAVNDSTLNSSPLFWKDRYISTSFSLFHFYHLETLLWPLVLGYMPRTVKYEKMSENSGIFKAQNPKDTVHALIQIVTVFNLAFKPEERVFHLKDIYFIKRY